MPITEIIFYVFSAVLVLAALSVITVRNPIYAALFLVLAFFSSACIWMLLRAEFLAITLVLVYVGAVMVLFLFVVMMLDVNTAPLKEGFARYLPVGILVALAMATQMFIVIWARGLDNPVLDMGQGEDYSHTAMLGERLYTAYLYPFEIAAVILLVAIISAIVLTHRRREGTKYQDPSQQVRIRRSERVRMVSMESGREED